MHVKLHVWRQAGPDAAGRMETYEADDISEEMSFLEMLDIVNERLNAEGKEPIAFEHDCREGICGSCGMMINGQAHGPQKGTATCQLHMRKFADGDEIHIEPWRAQAFPVLQGPHRRPPRLRPDRRGGRLHHRAHRRRARRQPHARSRRRWPTPRWTRPPASAAAPAWRRARTAPAQLFTSAKLNHLNLLPQGQAERYQRTQAMVDTMEQFFGSCTNHGECEEACPKEISIDFIAYMNRDYVKAQLKNRKLLSQG